jgi:hypothetical protein
MVGEETVSMSGQELTRVYVILNAMDKTLRQWEVGEILGLTARPVWRLI